MGKNNPRKVTIVLGNRDAKDSAELLALIARAVAKELRPNNVEIRLESPSNPACPDEQLETLAKERSQRTLKRANSRLMTLDPGVARRKLSLRVRQFARQGWIITAKVVSVAEKGAKIARTIHDYWRNS